MNIMSLGVAVLKDDLQSDHAHLVLPKPTQKAQLLVIHNQVTTSDAPNLWA